MAADGRRWSARACCADRLLHGTSAQRTGGASDPGTLAMDGGDAHRQTGALAPGDAMNLEKLGRFLLRGLRIGASTLSVVDLLRSDWTGGITAGVAWLVFLQVERRMPPLEQDADG
jgi:hypothetical protein